MKKRKSLRGPARRYRRSPERYAAVRHLSIQNMGGHVTKIGCRDAVTGRKNPYQPAARGLISIYREGYRTCDAIVAGRRLTSEQARLAAKFELEHVVRVASR